MDMNYRGGNVGGRGWAGGNGVKGGKWDNCNSIINKYIQKNKRKLTNWGKAKAYYLINAN